MRNADIKAALRNAAVYQWQVAEELGIPETTFSRKLRHELPDSEKTRILEAIERIDDKRGA